jgi:hypothetical protein
VFWERVYFQLAKTLVSHADCSKKRKTSGGKIQELKLEDAVHGLNDAAEYAQRCFANECSGDAQKVNERYAANENVR